MDKFEMMASIAMHHRNDTCPWPLIAHACGYRGTKGLEEAVNAISFTNNPEEKHVDKALAAATAIMAKVHVPATVIYDMMKETPCQNIEKAFSIMLAHMTDREILKLNTILLIQSP